MRLKPRYLALGCVLLVMEGAPVAAFAPAFAQEGCDGSFDVVHVMPDGHRLEDVDAQGELVGTATEGDESWAVGSSAKREGAVIEHAC